jgi:hypothetical protein
MLLKIKKINNVETVSRDTLKLFLSVVNFHKRKLPYRGDMKKFRNTNYSNNVNKMLHLIITTQFICYNCNRLIAQTRHPFK